MRPCWAPLWWGRTPCGAQVFSARPALAGRDRYQYSTGDTAGRVGLSPVLLGWTGSPAALGQERTQRAPTLRQHCAYSRDSATAAT